jgi:DNA-directed RNA polymerase subunit RPC12/RpoP
VKKPIKCPDCGSLRIEIGKPEYPKEIYDHKPKQPKVTYHEYRYACLKCRKEWLHDTLFNMIVDIPEDSQFYYDFNTKEFKLRKEAS